MEGTPLYAEESEEEEKPEDKLKKSENLGFFAVESGPDEQTALQKAWAETKREPEEEAEPVPKPAIETVPAPGTEIQPETAETPPSAEVPPPVPAEILPPPESTIEPQAEIAPDPQAVTAEAVPTDDAEDDQPDVTEEVPVPEAPEPAPEPPAEAIAPPTEPETVPEAPEPEPVPQPEAAEPEPPAAPEPVVEAVKEPEVPAPEPEADAAEQFEFSEGTGQEEESELPPAPLPEAPLPEPPLPEAPLPEAPLSEMPAQEQSEPEPAPETPEAQSEEQKSGRDEERDADRDETESSTQGTPSSSVETAPVSEEDRSSRFAEEKMDLEAAPKGPLTDRRIETMSREELLDIAREINVDGENLHHIYETHLIGERGLRRLIETYHNGGDLREALKNEMLEHEIDFERDPVMRDLAPQDGAVSNVPAGDANDQLIDRLLENSLSDNHRKEPQSTQKPPYGLQDDSHSWQTRHRHSKAALDALFIAIISILILLVIFVYLSRH